MSEPVSKMQKVQKLLKLDAGMLGQLKEAEQKLASEEAQKLEDSVPDGHPLKAEIEKQKALLGGDLSGLPPGHPLLRALQTAKETYEARQVEEVKDKPAVIPGAPAPAAATPAEQEPSQVRKAKRLEEEKVRRDKIAQEEHESDEIHDASREVNRKLDEILARVRETWETLQGKEEILTRTPMNRTRVMRLKRLLFASERGLSEIRMGRI